VDAIVFPATPRAAFQYSQLVLRMQRRRKIGVGVVPTGIDTPRRPYSTAVPGCHSDVTGVPPSNCPNPNIRRGVRLRTRCVHDAHGGPRPLSITFGREVSAMNQQHPSTDGTRIWATKSDKE
jgi:hypothetical protein